MIDVGRQSNLCTCHWILITAFNKHATGNGILQTKFTLLAQQTVQFMAVTLRKLSISV
jgi:hypothetical protein